MLAAWGKRFYVFYHDEDPPLHQSTRLADGTDRHTLLSEELDISGVARNVKIANFSVIRLNERWILFFELARAGTAEIAYADAKELPGPWIMRNTLASANGQPTENRAPMSPAAVVVGGSRGWQNLPLLLCCRLTRLANLLRKTRRRTPDGGGSGVLNAAILQGGFEAWRDFGMPL